MEDIVEIKASDGSTVFKFRKYDGRYISLSATGVEERYKKIKTLEFRKGDVLIVTYPKTGTHWLMDSVAMLLKGKDEVQIQTADGFLDFLSDIDALAKKESPRIMETHLLPRYLSDHFQANGKFILGLRNPKDTAVSFYHHMTKSSSTSFSGTWAHFYECYAKGQVPCGSFFEFYRTWQDFMTSHQDQFLIVYYEDMHKNYSAQLRRIADFLGCNLDDETISAIAKKGNINTVREELMKSQIMKEYAASLNKDGNLFFYRKGVVGDWKNHFTVAQNEMFDKIIEAEMKTLHFKFDYTQGIE